jgi:hypothetical protein
MSEQVTGKRRLEAEYRFRVGHLEPDVHENAGYRYEYSQSHYIQTPDLMGPYMTSKTFGESVEGIFDEAASGFETFYKEDAWLVPNDDF